MMLQNYEIWLLLIGLVAYNASNILQPFFARRYSVKLNANKKTVWVMLITILTLVVSFVMFFTSLSQVGLYLMIVMFCILSVVSWKNTLYKVRTTKQARWGIN